MRLSNRDDLVSSCADASSSWPCAVVQELVEAPLVCAGIMPANFVDSYALNLYHDGRSVNRHQGTTTDTCVTNSPNVAASFNVAQSAKSCYVVITQICMHQNAG